MNCQCLVEKNYFLLLFVNVEADHHNHFEMVSIVAHFFFFFFFLVWFVLFYFDVASLFFVRLQTHIMLVFKVVLFGI